MNRWIMLLMFLGLLFWGCFGYHLWKRIPKSSSGAENVSVAAISVDDLSRLVMPQNAPPENFRDPFQLPAVFRPVQKTVKSFAAEKPVVPAPVKAKPAITLDAILPGDRPVAILRHKGSTAVVRVGQEIWSVTVSEITQDFVKINYDGESFELRK
ncbi:MAG: hypothetical protein LBR60_07525 [Fibrobacter sp.]|jgi:hypothetical protein|nr:hypothetical protein [Fibrobacter sp.]